MTEVIEPTAGDGHAVMIPGDALPGTIFLLAQDARPFFPGQAFPVVMSAELWLPTFKALKDRGQDVVGVVMARGELKEAPTAERLHRMGTLCRIHKLQRHDDVLHVLLEGLERFEIRSWTRESLPLAARVRYYPERALPPSDPDAVKAYAVAVINTLKELVPLNPLYGEELKLFLARSNPNAPAQLADFAASLTSADSAELQRILETLPLLPRLEKVLELLRHEVAIARAQKEIRDHVDGTVADHQRKAFLREQLKYIQRELGLSKDDRQADAERFRKRLEGRTLPPVVSKRLEEEFEKLAVLEPQAPEYGVTRSYLDWASQVPWGHFGQDQLDLAKATKVLDAHHSGLQDVKDRILEHLAVAAWKGEVGGSTLLLLGPPGVGKTSLGEALAEATGRPFFRFSVGGLRDEAEIKGHRRTYLGAQPGKLVRALVDSQQMNPVILIDEIDKLHQGPGGDPGAALLELLDPGQNHAFLDHYLDCPLDLSRALFLCTANQLDTIPAPLLDRMERITLSGYLAQEKVAIAERHLVPRHLKKAGLGKAQFKLPRASLRLLIERYAREAGVRQLDQTLAALVRKSARQLLEHPDQAARWDRDAIEGALGPAPDAPSLPTDRPGQALGLAWTALGGATLPIEVAAVTDVQPGFVLTGQLGSVMQESATLAWQHLRDQAEALGVDLTPLLKKKIHLHVPAGATPKDGPSAGITMATALLSLALGQAPKKRLAMTGELTLGGAVYPVGGIREKLVAAQREGVRTVILPAANARDVKPLPEAVTRGLTLHYVSRFEEVAKLAFPSRF
ncbi:MAG: endopeptidase La [Gammaproteobacteria bacterium]|jgi:ATP-dependent Lon protease|nr:endopeptidase La [Gammaproteobacteria bacterium]